MKRYLGALFLVLITSAVSVIAADYQWDGGEKAIIDSNWNGGQATPFSTTIDGRTASSGNNVTISSGVATQSGAKIGFTTGTLTLSGSGTLQVLSGTVAETGRLYLGTSNVTTNSNLVVDGGTFKTDAGFCLYNGSKLTLKSGSVTTSNQTVYFQFGTLRVEGGSFDFSGNNCNLNMDAHKGTFNVSGGTVTGTRIVATSAHEHEISISGGKTTLSGASTFAGSAKVDISGGETTFGSFSLSNTASMNISGGINTVTSGYNNINSYKKEADGTISAGLFISGGSTTLTSSGINIGNGSGTNGYLCVSDGDLSLSLNLNIGNVSNGFVDINGGSVSAQFIRIGNTPGSSGTFNMTGGTLTQRNYSDGDGFFVGNNATGTLTMTGGTINATGRFYIGSNGTGTVTISDGNLNLKSFAYVGNNSGSKGTLNIDGGTVKVVSNSMYAGQNSGAEGTITISNGSLSLGQHLVIGQAGKGTLTQTGGSIVTGTNRDDFQDLYLGRNSGSNGTYNLYGGTAKVGRGFYIGNEGTGTLNVYVGENGTGYVATTNLIHNGAVTINEAAPFVILNTGSDGVYKYIEWTGTKSGSGTITDKTNGLLKSVTGSNYYGLQFAKDALNKDGKNIFDSPLTGVSAPTGSIWMDPNMNLYQLELTLTGITDMDAFIDWLAPQTDYDVKALDDSSIVIGVFENSYADLQSFGWDFRGYSAEAALTGIQGQGVPEPSSWLLLTLGVFGGCLYLRRRTQQTR